MNLNTLTKKLNNNEQLNKLEQAWYDWLTTDDDNDPDKNRTAQKKQDLFKHNKGVANNSPDYAPTWISACPSEIPQTKVIKNSVARSFDNFNAGLCFTDEYFEREPNTWIVDNDENIPENVSEVLLAEIQRQEEYDFEKNAERGVSSNQFTVSDINEKLQGYGLGYSCSTLVDLRSKEEYQCWVGTYPVIDTTGFTIIKLGDGLAEQLDEFGKKIFIPVGRKGQSKKYEKKEAALVNALSRAFAPRSIRPSESTIKTLHLETTSTAEDCGQSWTPLTANPMDVIIDEEQQEIRARKARHELVKVRQHLGADKWCLLMESLTKTNGQIAAQINANGGDTNTACIQKRVRRIRKALETLGCPF